MTLFRFRTQIIFALSGICLLGTAQSQIPIWSFNPDPNFPARTFVSPTEPAATVKYTISNNSSTKTHRLVLSSKTPRGISQVGGPCVRGWS